MARSIIDKESKFEPYKITITIESEDEHTAFKIKMSKGIYENGGKIGSAGTELYESLKESYEDARIKW